MARTKKKEPTIGERAAQIAESAGVKLSNVTKAVATVKATVVDVKQAIPQDLGANQPRTLIVKSTDAYGSYKPLDVSQWVDRPSDPFNPQIETISTDEYTNLMTTYEGGVRKLQVVQKYLDFIGEQAKVTTKNEKVKQLYVGAETESIKTQQKLVQYDNQRMGLEIDLLKLDQTAQKLNMESDKFLALQKEGEQLKLLIEAQEGKRDAVIKRLQEGSANIKQEFIEV